MLRRKFSEILLLLALVLALTAFGFAAAAVSKSGQNVTIQSSTLHGDACAADGLTMTVHHNYENTLYWDTTLSCFDPSHVTSSCRYVPNGISLFDPAQPPLSLVFGEYPLNLLSEGLQAAADAQAEALAKSAGQSSCVYTKLHSHEAYYTPLVRLSHPDCLFSAERADSPDSSTLLDSDFIDYFKISTLPDEQLELQFSVLDGKPTLTSVQTSSNCDHYAPHTFSTAASDAIYFCIGSRSQQGQLLNFDQLPEGYGIFSVPLVPSETEGQKQLASEQLDMIYGLNPRITVLDLQLTPDQSQLLLLTEESDACYLTVLDLPTGAPVQRTALNPADAVYLWPGSNYLVLRFQSPDRLAVYSKAADGSYSMDFICDIPDDALPLYANGTATSYDGHRLAIGWSGFWYQSLSMEQLAEWYVAVYTADGEAYWGGYDSSFAQEHIPMSYYQIELSLN